LDKKKDDTPREKKKRPKRHHHIGKKGIQHKKEKGNQKGKLTKGKNDQNFPIVAIHHFKGKNHDGEKRHFEYNKNWVEKKKEEGEAEK